ncbi:MAG: PilZ domain-containing protein [Hyphomonas sp.]|tara:strand:- start:11703 stop:12074 length:372 start_codon:yes stop_codon:yes gene_type:complete
MNRFTSKLQAGFKWVQMEIRRAEPRVQAYRPGRVVWPDLSASRDISILDMSPSGAKLTFGEGAMPPELPHEFFLFVHGRGGSVSMRRVCEKRWQQDEFVGVRFVQRMDDEDFERMLAAEPTPH